MKGHRRALLSAHRWTLAAVLASIAICVVTGWLHLEQRRVLDEAAELVEGFRRARVDLGKGFVHVSLSGQPGSPFDREQGLALIAQAVDELRRPAPGQTAPPAGLERSVRAFDAELARVAAEPTDSIAETRLRIAFHDLERHAAELDRAHQERLETLKGRLDRHWLWAIALAAGLLAAICAAVYLAGRAQTLALAALQVSEARLAEVAEMSPNVIHSFHLALDGTMSFPVVGPRIREIFGIEADELAIDARAAVERWHPDDLPNVLATLTHSHKNLAPVHEEFRVLHPDRGERWVEIRSAPVREADGSTTWHGVISDVTARKTAELVLVEKDRMLEATGELARVGGWQFDVLTGEGAATTEVARLYDLDPVTISKEAGFEFFVGESRALLEKAVARAISEGESYDLELELLSAKGVTKWVRTIGRPVIEGGRVTRVEGAMQDVSERKRVELALRESEERFRQMAESIDEVFWLTDPSKGEMLYVSPAYERIWGRSRESLYQQPSTWIEAIHPEDQGRIREAASHRQTQAEYDETYRIVRPDGTVRWVRDRAFPIRDAEGAIFRIAGTAIDVTQARDLEAQMRQAQKLEAVGTLAGGVAHDFNNILGGIVGFAELLRWRVGDDAESLEHIDALLRATQRAAEVVRQILTFSRRQEQRRSPVQLAELLREPLGLLRATIPSPVELVVALSAEAPTVLADPVQIHQVVMNLGANAWQSLEGRRGRVSFELDSVTLGRDAAAEHRLEPGTFARLRVSDTGRGIPAEILGRVFEPFFTTKGPGEGSGLGLSVVHGIVLSHDGAITVESKPGVGTTFELYFPATTKPVAPAAVVAVPSTSEPVSGRVLFVDDEEALVSLGQRILVRLGYEVVATVDPMEALERFTATPDVFDVVVTDYAMPGLTGLELVRELRALRPQLPVVLTTGFASEPESLGLAGLELVHKPYQVQTLADAIRRARGR